MEKKAMSSDLQRFLGAVRTLAKLAHEYNTEPFLEALGRYATVKQEGEVWFVGTFLDEIGEELSKRRVRPCCRECGKEIACDVRYDDRDPRADALYCSPACRQSAYRSRVADKDQKHKRKRNGNRTSLRMERKKRERAVTVEKLLEAGIDPRIIITSLNIDGSDDAGD
jgi:hypothetical protein